MKLLASSARAASTCSVCALSFLLIIARADAQVPAPQVLAAAPQVLAIDSDHLDTLQNLPPQRAAWNEAAQRWVRMRGDVDAVEVNLSRQQLRDRDNASARSALLRWVSAGGVAILHNNAAQEFGFQTVPARLATRERAGQLFNRARGDLSLNAQPLLSGSSPLSPLGVHLVFSQLQEGDALVLGHARGVGLLRVTDLTEVEKVDASDQKAAQFVSALAPYGRGWALFVPRSIETHRADGALFQSNLSRWLIAQRPDVKSGLPQTVSVEAAMLEELTRRVQVLAAQTLAEIRAIKEKAAQAALEREQVRQLQVSQSDPTGGAKPAGTTGKVVSQEVAEAAQGVEAALPTLDVEALLLQANELPQLRAATERMLAPPSAAPEIAPLPDVPQDAPLDDEPQDAPDAPTVARKAGPDLTPLWLSRDEVRTMRAALRRLMDESDERGRPFPPLNEAQKHELLRAVTTQALLWRMRLQWQRDDGNGASDWLRLAAMLSPTARPVLWWQGTISAAAGRDIGHASPQRVAWLSEAVDWWRQALRSARAADDEASDESAAVERPVLNMVPEGEAVLGLERGMPQLARGWAGAVQVLANAVALQPPLAMVQDNTTTRVVLRYFNREGVDPGADPNLYRMRTGLHPSNYDFEFDSWLMSLMVFNYAWKVKQNIFLPKAEDRFLYVNQSLGWRADEEEIIGFLWPNDYNAYRRAIGATRQNALLYGRNWDTEVTNKSEFNYNNPVLFQAGGAFITGDTVKNQILMTLRVAYYKSQYGKGKTAFNPVRGEIDLPNGDVTGNVPIPSTTPRGLGHLHAHALTDALAGGGTPLPLWLQLGLDVLSAQEILRNLTINESDWAFTELSFAQARAVLQPENGGMFPQQWLQLKNQIGSGKGEMTRVRRLEAQAQLMVRFLYDRFGQGAVVETLQRLGSGQTINQALIATTGLTENDIFVALKAQ
ncbi:MAG: hypothetical protein ACR2GG_11630 [Gemmatimonadaceae bacterium]